jgi:hypothetical protein
MKRVSRLVRTFFPRVYAVAHRARLAHQLHKLQTQ